MSLTNWRDDPELTALAESTERFFEYGGSGGDFRHDVTLVEAVGRYGVEGFTLSSNEILKLLIARSL